MVLGFKVRLSAHARYDRGMTYLMVIRAAMKVGLSIRILARRTKWYIEPLPKISAVSHVEK